MFDSGKKIILACKFTNIVARNALHEYLKLQFCQENLLFYEVVMDWKLISGSDSIARNSGANFIREHVCQNN